MKRFDVAIVGAGPAGAVTACQLARQGYHVALIDKAHFPREKLCGDFVNPINWTIFQHLGIDQAIRALPHTRVTRFRLSAPDGTLAESRLPVSGALPQYGLGLRRLHLDDLLQRTAVKAGAESYCGFRVAALTRSTDAWRLTLQGNDEQEAIVAAILVGADGRNSWIAHRLGLARKHDSNGTAIGFQFQCNSAHGNDDAVAIHLFPGGYAGVVGQGDGTVNLCLAVERRALAGETPERYLWEALMPRNPHLRGLLARTAARPKPRTTAPVYFKPRRSFEERLLLVGDAARVSEPVSGEGIYFAMRSGLLAAETINDAFAANDYSARGLVRYHARCRSVFAKRRALNMLIRYAVYRPAVIAPFIRLAARHERVLAPFVTSICLPDAI